MLISGISLEKTVAWIILYICIYIYIYTYISSNFCMVECKIREMKASNYNKRSAQTKLLH